MKYLLITFLLFGCHYKAKDDESTDVDKHQKNIEKRDFYCSQEINIYDYVDRCDGATFIGLYNAYCRGDEIYDHEYSYTIDEEMNVTKTEETGQLNRDVQPCFELDLDGDGRTDSRSGCSFESIVGPLHTFYAKQDGAILKRIYQRAKSEGYVFGAGPREYTYLPHLYFILDKMVDKYTLRLADEENSEDALPDVIEKLKGYRGKVIALYLDLKGKVYGYLNTAEMGLLVTVYDQDPENPIYNKLMGRYGEDGQKYLDKATDILYDEEWFPSDRLPNKNYFDWGDDAPWIIYAWVMSI